MQPLIITKHPKTKGFNHRIWGYSLQYENHSFDLVWWFFVCMSDSTFIFHWQNDHIYHPKISASSSRCSELLTPSEPVYSDSTFSWQRLYRLHSNTTWEDKVSESLRQVEVLFGYVENKHWGMPEPPAYPTLKPIPGFHVFSDAPVLAVLYWIKNQHFGAHILLSVATPLYFKHLQTEGDINSEISAWVSQNI